MPRSLAMASRLDTAPFPPVKAMLGSVCVGGEATGDYLGELAGGRGGRSTLLPGGRGGPAPQRTLGSSLPCVACLLAIIPPSTEVREPPRCTVPRLGPMGDFGSQELSGMLAEELEPLAARDAGS